MLASISICKDVWLTIQVFDPMKNSRFIEESSKDVRLVRTTESEARGREVHGVIMLIPELLVG
jgi:hypothetical protein